MASHRGRLQPMLEVHRQFCHMGLFHAVQVWPGGAYNTVLDEEHAPGDGAQPDLCPQSGEEQGGTWQRTKSQSLPNERWDKWSTPQ